MTVLVVTYELPYPPCSGSRIRDLNTIRCLARDHEVLLVSLLTDPDDAGHVNALRPLCEHVEVIDGRRSPAGRATAIARGVLARRPLAASPYFFPELAVRIREIVTRRRVDLVVFEQAFVAPYIDVLPASRPSRTVLSLHNVVSRQYRSMERMEPRRAGRVVRSLKAHLMGRLESRYLARFDHCIAVSGHEARLLHAIEPALPVTVVENGVDTDALQPLEEPSEGNGLVFVGNMRYAPNEDAAHYLCGEVLPRVADAVPDVTLCIVGDRPSRELTPMKSARVQVTGRVADVTAHYSSAKVAVAPLRAGGGTRMKVLEAMALGRAVVSTSIGVEGLEVTPGEHVMVADTPAAFAAAVVHLLTDHDARRTLARNARRLVESRYDWTSINRRLSAVYADILAAPLNDASGIPVSPLPT